MRRFFFALITAALFVGPAAAFDRVNLSWDHCAADGWIGNKNFACNTNAGSDMLVGSFVLDQAVTGIVSAEVSVWITSAGGPAPSWWMFRSAGSCRQSSLTFSAAPAAGASACTTTFPASVAGFMTYAPVGYDNQLLALILQVPGADSATALAGREQFLFRLNLDHAKTVGAGSCAGCSTPTCIGWGRLRLNRVGNPPVTIETAGQYIASWQGAGSSGMAHVPCGAYCPYTLALQCGAATSAHASTWGAIKSLYH